MAFYKELGTGINDPYLNGVGARMRTFTVHVASMAVWKGGVPLRLQGQDDRKEHRVPIAPSVC